MMMMMAMTQCYDSVYWFCFSANKSRTFYICNSPKIGMCLCVCMRVFVVFFFIRRKINRADSNQIRSFRYGSFVHTFAYHFTRSSLWFRFPKFIPCQTINWCHLFISIEGKKSCHYEWACDLTAIFFSTYFLWSRVGRIIHFCVGFYSQYRTIVHVFLCTKRINGQQKIPIMHAKKWIPDGVALQNKRRRCIVLMTLNAYPLGKTAYIFAVSFSSLSFLFIFSAARMCVRHFLTTLQVVICVLFSIHINVFGPWIY